MKPRHLPLLFLSLLPPLAAGDQLAASVRPPGGLSPAQIPQFVLLGFDDNPQAGPMTWLVDHLRDKRDAGGTPVRAVFFSSGRYWSDRVLIAVHHRALTEGHEIANHTQNHENGGAFKAGKWREEMAACEATFTDTGIPAAGVVGFRAPFLAYNAAMFEALAAEHQLYDSTLGEGAEPGQDGTNFSWPYTLHEGSPANARENPEGSPKRIGRHPGLWEIPLHAFIIPPDEACAAHGIQPGLRARVGTALKVSGGSGEPADRIGGLDWSVLEAAQCTGPELLAILKHTLDLRLAGNRAPFMVGGHTALYPANKPDRRKAIEEFIAYALGKPEVRFVTGKQLIAWLRAPTALGGN